jgi:AraC family transcriptional activator of pobA
VFGFVHVEPFAAGAAPNNERPDTHRHQDFDQLTILWRGTCTFAQDGHQGGADGPCVVYTPANVIHRFSYSPEAEGFLVSVSSGFAAGLPSVAGTAATAMVRLADNRVLVLRSKRQLTVIRHLIDLLVEKSACRDRYRLDVLRYAFGALMLEFETALEQSGGTPAVRIAEDDANLFWRFRQAIQSTVGMVGIDGKGQPIELCKVEDFARRLSVTRYRLNMVCERLCGTSACEVIYGAILDHATRLLLCTTKRIKEISFLLGYSHASHFSRFFKQRLGVTPEVFRLSAGLMVRAPSALPRSLKIAT